MSNCNCPCHARDEYAERHQEDIAAEQKAVETLKRLAEELAPHLPYIWHWGDGEGGYILVTIADIAENLGYPVYRHKTDLSPGRPGEAKAPGVPRSLRRAVFERDGYVCQTPGCGERFDLCADHIYPESGGGETTLENLQTLCRPCNTRKGSKIPAGMER